MIGPATVQLRPGRPDDAAAMAGVLVAAWRHGYPGIVPDDVIEAQTVAGWEPVLAAAQDPGTRTTVAVDGAGRLVGFTRFGPDPDRPGPHAGYLSSLYVDPAAAGAGVGRRLLDRALRELTRCGRTTVSLWVFRDNARARTLYERCGFEATTADGGDGAERVDERWRAPLVRYSRTIS